MNAAIRAALADNLATITDTQINQAGLSNPTNPSIQIFPGPIQYDQAFNRGLDRREWRVIVLVPSAVETEAQTLLDLFLEPTGSKSVKAAIESDRTLGGTVDNLQVTGDSGQQTYADQNPPVIGAEWTLVVYSPGT